MVMDLIKEIYSSDKLPEVKIIEFDTYSDVRGQIWTSFASELDQALLPDNISFKHDKFNTNKKGCYGAFMEMKKPGNSFHAH